MIDIITFKGQEYPAFQGNGFASKFAFPFALEVCKGIGFDIGCNREEWALPGAVMVDPAINAHYSATFLPTEDLDSGFYRQKIDYIFSSHCLEHINNPFLVLDYWHKNIKKGGVLFLYLPDFSQVYWRPWHNRKHVNAFTPQILKAYFSDNTDMWKNVFVSGVDLNNSFMVMAEKA